MKQSLIFLFAVLFLLCASCLPQAVAPASDPTPEAASPAAEPTARPEQTALGVIASAENGSIAFIPLPGEALRASADLIAFSSAGLADIGAKKGDIIRVQYAGDAAETYPAQITASDWALLEPTSELYALLAETASSLFPGTAGCSLTAARCAGQLLDYAAQAKLAPESASAVAAAFRASLSAESAALLAEQLSSLSDAAAQLLSGTGETLLESAGYEPKAYPWDGQTSAAFLSSILRAAS